MPETKYSPHLNIDFDGVINSYVSGWTEASDFPDPPVPGAIEMIMEYMNHFVVCVTSSRLNRQSGDPDQAIVIMKAMADWFVKWGMPESRIRTFADFQPQGCLPGMVNLCKTKPPAILTIDDRGWCFDGTWPTVDQIKEFRPWNKREKS